MSGGDSVTVNGRHSRCMFPTPRTPRGWWASDTTQPKRHRRDTRRGVRRHRAPPVPAPRAAGGGGLDRGRRRRARCRGPAGTGKVLFTTDMTVAGVHADLELIGLDDLGWRAMAARTERHRRHGGPGRRRRGGRGRPPPTPTSTSSTTGWRAPPTPTAARWWAGTCPTPTRSWWRWPSPDVVRPTRPGAAPWGSARRPRVRDRAARIVGRRCCAPCRSGGGRPRGHRHGPPVTSGRPTRWRLTVARGRAWPRVRSPGWRGPTP